MKTKFMFRLFSLVICVAWISAAVIAQTPAVDTTGASTSPFADGGTSLSELVNWYEILYGALVILWGYIGKAFGLQTKVSNYVFVVAAGALVLGGAFIALGFGSVIPYVFSFLSAIGVYDLFLKPGSRLLGLRGAAAKNELAASN